jgi:hypothetical protein
MTATVAGTWWREPVLDFIAYVDQERAVVQLSRASVEALAAQDPYSSGSGSPDLIAQAQAQTSDDHPFLHGHSLVALWGAMETMVIDVVTAWLRNRPDVLAHPKIADLKLPFGKFQAMSEDERFDFVANELDRQRAQAAGISRFESLLDPVGLSGSYNGVLGRNLYEMRQIRNVFAHKRGQADGRFVALCPQLGYSVGDRLHIDSLTWSDFTVTAVAYAEVVLRRMREQLGLAVDEEPTTVEPVRYRHTQQT